MLDMLRSAKAYAAMGLAVFPLHSHDPERVCTCPKGPACHSPAKHPRTLSGLKEASTDPATLERWWTMWPDANVGVCTGGGFLVVDVDIGHDGDASLASLEQNYGELPVTPEAVTGSGGLHIWLTVDGDTRNTASIIGPGIDTRGDGGYVVAPPSVHASGQRYRWRDSLDPIHQTFSPAPAWLLDLMTKPKNGNGNGTAPAVGETIVERERNSTLASLAGSMRRRGMSEDAILAALRTENAAKCRPPLDDDEVVAVARSIARYTAAAPVSKPADPPAKEAKRIPFEVLLGDRMDALLALKKQPVDAVPTPWRRWNACCRGRGGGLGLARGWHVIGAARSGAGKTVLAVNMAVMAMRVGESVGFISLEMDQAELETRVLPVLTGIPVRSFEEGQHFEEAAFVEAKRALHELHERTGGSFWVNRKQVRKLPDVIAAMRHAHDDLGCRFMIVDYLQLAGNPMMPETIAAVSDAVRGQTVELNVTTFGLSQFNRETSKSKERPSKEGLMGGSFLENDANQVILMDHSRVERTVSGIQTFAILDKNRHGPMTDIAVDFDTATLRMYERDA